MREHSDAMPISQPQAPVFYRGLARFALALAALASFTGCTRPSSYAGIPSIPAAASQEVQHLARLARAGDKQAQMDLGRRFEEGRGVPVDRDKARALYRAAATDVGGTRMAFVPGGHHGTVSAVSLSSGRRIAGLPAAAARLSRLDNPGATAAPPTQTGSALTIGERRTIRGRLLWVDIQGMESAICHDLAPAYKARYGAQTVECEVMVYLLRTRGNTIRTVYGLKIRFDDELTERMIHDMGGYIPGGTTIMEPYPESSKDDKKEMCGTFAIRELSAGTRKFTVIIAPIRRGRIDGEFTGRCAND